MRLTPSRWGTGPIPALLLHGFTGSRHSFDHLQPLLGDLLRATCVDLPGHGRTALPRTSGTDGTDGAKGFLEIVEAIAGLLEEPGVLLGYSQGARLALAVAARHPSRVRCLVLESVRPGLKRASERLERRKSDEALAKRLLRDGVPAFVDRWEQEPLFAGLRALPVEARVALRARRTAHTAEGLAGALRCMGQGMQPDLWPWLPELRVPTLLLTGQRDRRYTGIARRMAARLPRARQVSFSGTGHAPHLERPREYAAEVRAFLEDEWTLNRHLEEESRS
ncbi:MAG: 2-succinyl-6-hydroxy-2,4-cyclohexadiene-1-carboxylate synthase [Deltaproteobacteria bacterium]|nr:2-succinyl-6-hydroxy-2,4-cyclohexadiene-1-carboxylate synthase [Deltaproteobacteria bacterium]